MLNLLPKSGSKRKLDQTDSFVQPPNKVACVNKVVNFNHNVLSVSSCSSAISPSHSPEKCISSSISSFLSNQIDQSHAINNEAHYQPCIGTPVISAIDHKFKQNVVPTYGDHLFAMPSNKHLPVNSCQVRIYI